MIEIMDLGPFNIMLRPISTQENKHGIRPDRNKIEPAHGLTVAMFLYCSRHATVAQTTCVTCQAWLFSLSYAL